jgi:hypothetical protein
MTFGTAANGVWANKLSTHADHCDNLLGSIGDGRFCTHRVAWVRGGAYARSDWRRQCHATGLWSAPNEGRSYPRIAVTAQPGQRRARQGGQRFKVPGRTFNYEELIGIALLVAVAGSRAGS